MASRAERIYFLYGSQTGNSEQAALDLATQAITQLSPDRLQKLTGKDASDIVIEPVHMQLDDFLELQQCQWTRLVVIVVSSYGVGQAPLGSWRFRELCDAWTGLQKEGKVSKSLLEGVHYALCGLGDSKYTTYFRSKYFRLPDDCRLLSEHTVLTRLTIVIPFAQTLRPLIRGFPVLEQRVLVPWARQMPVEKATSFKAWSSTSGSTPYGRIWPKSLFKHPLPRKH